MSPEDREFLVAIATIAINAAERSVDNMEDVRAHFMATSQLFKWLMDIKSKDCPPEIRQELEKRMLLKIAGVCEKNEAQMAVYQESAASIKPVYESLRQQLEQFKNRSD